MFFCIPTVVVWDFFYQQYQFIDFHLKQNLKKDDATFFWKIVGKKNQTTISLSMNLGVGDFMPHLLAQKAGKVVDPNGSQTPRKTQKTRLFFVEVAFKQKEITVQNRLSHKKKPGLTFHDSILVVE